jgi:cupin fold WbuC family metalloprotein
MNHNFHRDNADNPHRFLNVFLRGTYVRPHRHREPPKSESFVVLSGHVVVFAFDDAGSVTSGYLLGDSAWAGKMPSRVTHREAARGIDLAPGIWHTITALSPTAVCYEVKPGPWDPVTDKEFAAWAPAEGSAEATGYLEKLLA